MKVVFSDDVLEAVRRGEIREMEFAVIPISRREGDLSLIRFVDEGKAQVTVTIGPRRAIKVEVLDREGNLISYEGRVSLEYPVSD